MRAAIAILGLFVCARIASGHEVSAPAGTASMDPKAAEAGQVVDAFHEALTKGDRAAAQALLDEEVQIYEQGWVERSKAEYASHHLDSDIEFSAATKSARTARSGVLLGDLAYVSSEGKIAGTFKGKTIDSITLETMVLRRTDGRWRILHIHWSSRDAKK